MSWAIRHCRGCAQPIIWTETERGRKMPVDARPSEEGTFVLLTPRQYYPPGHGGTDDVRTPISVHVSKVTSLAHLALNEGKPFARYTAHHATCTEKDAHGW